MSKRSPSYKPLLLFITLLFAIGCSRNRSVENPTNPTTQDMKKNEEGKSDNPGGGNGDNSFPGDDADSSGSEETDSESEDNTQPEETKKDPADKSKQDQEKNSCRVTDFLDKTKKLGKLAALGKKLVRAKPKFDRRPSKKRLRRKQPEDTSPTRSFNKSSSEPEQDDKAATQSTKKVVPLSSEFQGNKGKQDKTPRGRSSSFKRAVAGFFKTIGPVGPAGFNPKARSATNSPKGTARTPFQSGGKHGAGKRLRRTQSSMEGFSHHSTTTGSSHHSTIPKSQSTSNISGLAANDSGSVPSSPRSTARTPFQSSGKHGAGKRLRRTQSSMEEDSSHRSTIPKSQSTSNISGLAANDSRSVPSSPRSNARTPSQPKSNSINQGLKPLRKSGSEGSDYYKNKKKEKAKKRLSVTTAGTSFVATSESAPGSPRHQRNLSIIPEEEELSTSNGKDGGQLPTTTTEKSGDKGNVAPAPDKEDEDSESVTETASYHSDQVDESDQQGEGLESTSTQDESSGKEDIEDLSSPEDDLGNQPVEIGGAKTTLATEEKETSKNKSDTLAKNQRRRSTGLGGATFKKAFRRVSGGFRGSSGKSSSGKKEKEADKAKEDKKKKPKKNKDKKNKKGK